jgi:hypothetical protein
MSIPWVGDISPNVGLDLTTTKAPYFGIAAPPFPTSFWSFTLHLTIEQNKEIKSLVENMASCWNECKTKFDQMK